MRQAHELDLSGREAVDRETEGERVGNTTVFSLTGRLLSAYSDSETIDVQNKARQCETLDDVSSSRHAHETCLPVHHSLVSVCTVHCSRLCSLQPVAQQQSH